MYETTSRTLVDNCEGKKDIYIYIYSAIQTLVKYQKVHNDDLYP